MRSCTIQWGSRVHPGWNGQLFDNKRNCLPADHNVLLYFFLPGSTGLWKHPVELENAFPLCPVPELDTPSHRPTDARVPRVAAFRGCCSASKKVVRSPHVFPGDPHGLLLLYGRATSHAPSQTQASPAHLLLRCCILEFASNCAQMLHVQEG